MVNHATMLHIGDGHMIRSDQIGEFVRDGKDMYIVSVHGSTSKLTYETEDLAREAFDFIAGFYPITEEETE